jgi:hypothetical protein
MNVNLEQLYLYCKIIGAVSTVGGIVVGGFSWLKKTYNQAQKTSDNVTLLMTNHFPHLQQSITKQDVILDNLSSDLRNVTTTVGGIEQQQEDLKVSVRGLSDSFLRHLEFVADQPKKKKR